MIVEANLDHPDISENSQRGVTLAVIEETVYFKMLVRSLVTIYTKKRRWFWNKFLICAKIQSWVMTLQKKW